MLNRAPQECFEDCWEMTQHAEESSLGFEAPPMSLVYLLCNYNREVDMCFFFYLHQTGNRNSSWNIPPEGYTNKLDELRAAQEELIWFADTC